MIRISAAVLQSNTISTSLRMIPLRVIPQKKRDRHSDITIYHIYHIKYDGNGLKHLLFVWLPHAHLQIALT